VIEKVDPNLYNPKQTMMRIGTQRAVCLLLQPRNLMVVRSKKDLGEVRFVSPVMMSHGFWSSTASCDHFEIISTAVDNSQNVLRDRIFPSNFLRKTMTLMGAR